MAGFGARKFAEQQRLIHEYEMRKQREAEEAEHERQRRIWEEQERERLWHLQQQQEEEQRQAQIRWHEEQQRRREFEYQDRMRQQEQLAFMQQQETQQHHAQQQAQQRALQQAQDQAQRQAPQRDPWSRYAQDSQQQVPSSSKPRASEYNQLVEETYQHGAQGTFETNTARNTQYTQYTITEHQQQRDTYKANAQARDPVGNVSSARKSVARATMYEELPKAKCADCGLQISFEQLATHQCTAAMLRSNSAATSNSSKNSSPLSLIIPLHDTSASSSTNDRSRTPDSARSETRSPFLQRYDSVFNRSPHPDSPAFAPGSLESDPYKRMPASASPTIGSFADAEAASQREDTKRQIAAQREAKKRGGAAAAADVVIAAMRLKEGAARKASPLSSQKNAMAASISAPQLNRQESGGSSASSAKSSLLEPNYHRPRASSSASRTIGSSSSGVTPSTSYDRFSESRETSDSGHRKKSSEEQRRPSLGSRTPSTEKDRPATSAQPKKTRKKSDVDISSIEALMSDLQPPSSRAPVRRGTDSDLAATAASLKAPSAPLRASTSDGFAASKKKSSRTGAKANRRCCICDCSLSSSRTPFVERDEKFFCARDYAKRYLPKCRKCDEPVESNAVKSSDGALRGIFHRQCFTCFHCDAGFDDGTFYVFENNPYCAAHYHLRNGTLCEGCGQGIEGLCKQTEGGERYHPHCLRCEFEGLSAADKGEFCQEVSTQKALGTLVQSTDTLCSFQPLDDFYVINGKRLCDWHAQRTQTFMKKAGRTVNAHKRRTMLRDLK